MMRGQLGPQKSTALIAVPGVGSAGGVFLLSISPLAAFLAHLGAGRYPHSLSAVALTL